MAYYCPDCSTEDFKIYTYRITDCEICGSEVVLESPTEHEEVEDVLPWEPIQSFEGV